MNVNPSNSQVNVVIGELSVGKIGDFVDKNNAVEGHKDHPGNDVDTSQLPWGPWISHYAWKSGNKVLNAVDFAGESLATFFGITSPKFQIEIDEYERIMEEKKKMEEESVGWTPKNVGGDIPLVLNEPGRVGNTHTS